MSVLMPMAEAAYPAYAEASIQGYAGQNVAAGRWPADGAVERARAEFDRLLPKGPATPDNHLYEIKAPDGVTTVGQLWVALQRHPAGISAHVFDVVVLSQHRRQGHARRAFLAMEPVVAALGATSIGLHVHAHNTGAQALYRSLGYGVTGLNMQKPLG